MNDEFKEIDKPVKRDNDVLFDEYVNRNRYGSRFWLSVTLVFCAILAAVVYKVAVLDKIIPPEVLKNSLQIFAIDSQWVVQQEVHEKDFNGIILVPQVSFRFRNIGKIDLSYVSVLGVFRLLNQPRSIGEDNQLVLKDSLKPGGESERIVLTSGFGYRASSKEAFARNSKEWQNATAEIYVKSGSSVFIYFNNFYIIKRIEGLNMGIDVNIK
ncbi:MAG: hypothetical protein NT166_23820 [Candidatus Aminicenantes bacterium]|nr:hypothetical protein [Candidatus Aminicenantes bacterium]